MRHTHATWRSGGADRPRFTLIIVLALAISVLALAPVAPNAPGGPSSTGHSAVDAAHATTSTTLQPGDSRYTDKETLDTKAAGDRLVLLSWTVALYFISGLLAAIIVLFDGYGWLADKGTARRWAYLSLVTSVLGVVAYMIWKAVSFHPDRHRNFCYSCGSYFEGKPELCPNCGAPAASGTARKRAINPM